MTGVDVAVFACFTLGVLIGFRLPRGWIVALWQRWRGHS